MALSFSLTLSLSRLYYSPSLSKNIYLDLIYYGVCTSFWDSELREFFEDLCECPRPHFGFSRIIGSTVYLFLYMDLYSYFVLGWTLVFVSGWVPRMCMYISVTNVYIRVVYFLYLCHACDVVSYCLIMRVWLIDTNTFVGTLVFGPSLRA